MKKLVLIPCILLFFCSVSTFAQWYTTGNTATATDYLGTNNNFPLKFYTNGQQRMALSSAGRLSLGLSSSTRLVHIHGTGPILAEMGSQIPPPPGSESLIVITNTESGSTAWDGLRIGIVGNVAQVATLDKIRLDIANDQSTISLKGDGRINFFSLSGNYDAKIGIRSTSENALYIDNSSNENGYALKIKVTDNSTQAFSLFNGANGKFVLLGNGQVGIGTMTPDANYMLDVNGQLKVVEVHVLGQVGIGTSAPDVNYMLDVQGQLKASEVHVLGQVGIGTASPDAAYHLDIAGKMRACEVRVNNPGWCDYVFASDYKLMPMSQLANYIHLNQHLPEMPSAQDVELQGGFDLASMSIALLKRSEENTLYILQLEEKALASAKELEEQKAVALSAQKKAVELEKRLGDLETRVATLLQTISPAKN